ncbi:hypothetical protein GF337_15105 [candidate division KSB1 bacterium]|nr:hypothetical protein [candidate division KSB1 bacterium]
MNLVSLKRITILIFSSIILAGIFTSCGEKGSQPVARVGGRVISESEFINSYSSGKTSEDLASASIEDKRDHLDKMIDRELMLVAAYQQNLDQDSLIVEQVEDRGEAEVFRHLYETKVIDQVISEDVIRDIYEKSKKQVKIQDVFLQLGSNPSEEEQQEFDTKLNLIKEDINEGIEFEDIVRKYSDDKKRKGLLKWSASTMDNPVHQQAFSMKEGEISEPIKTNLGYSIIKVVEIRKMNVKPYESEKTKIKRELMRKNSKDLQKRAQEYIETLKEKYNAKLEEENIQKFVEIFKGEETDTTAAEAEPARPSLANFTEEDKELKLISYAGGGLTIGEFINEIKNIPPMRLPRLDEEKSVTTILNQGFFAQSLLRKLMHEKELMKEKEVQEKLSEYRENFMVNLIRKNEIDEKIELHEDSLKQYYEENKEEFKTPVKREVREISIKDKELAEKVAKRAKAGENFLKLTRKYNEKSLTKKKDGYLGFVTKSPRHIGKAAFDVNIGEVAGPIKIGNNYSVIKVLSEQDAKYQSFEDAKPRIRIKVQSDMRKKREQQWKEDLNEEIKVTVYDNRLEDIFSDMNASE